MENTQNNTTVQEGLTHIASLVEVIDPAWTQKDKVLDIISNFVLFNLLSTELNAVKITSILIRALKLHIETGKKEDINNKLFLK